MLRFADAQGVTRRDFLRVGGATAGALGLSLLELDELHATPPAAAENCIVLFLVGGPSQLETWDPKPNAPDEIRGPFRTLRTNVPGIQISEHFPRMACMADRYAIVRTVHHEHQAIHETGQQLLQTGRLCAGGVEQPTLGAVLSHVRGPKKPHVPTSVILPTPIGNTGVCVSHGQSAGFLGSRHEPLASEVCFDGFKESAIGDRYGANPFGHACLRARQLVERGVRLVTVNMFDTVYDRFTWDCHADGDALATTFDEYKNILCPMFDQAYTTLLEDLAQSGRLEKTLVVAMGEFGRTPTLNYRGGRDHWTRCWSVLFAGGGVRGGQVIGRSDARAAEPLDRPVHASEIAASIFHNLGVTAAERRSIGIVEAQTVRELFA